MFFIFSGCSFEGSGNAWKCFNTTRMLETKFQIVLAMSRPWCAFVKTLKPQDVSLLVFPTSESDNAYPMEFLNLSNETTTRFPHLLFWTDPPWTNTMQDTATFQVSDSGLWWLCLIIQSNGVFGLAELFGRVAWQLDACCSNTCPTHPQREADFGRPPLWMSDKVPAPESTKHQTPRYEAKHQAPRYEVMGQWSFELISLLAGH